MRNSNNFCYALLQCLCIYFHFAIICCHFNWLSIHSSCPRAQVRDIILVASEDEWSKPASHDNPYAALAKPVFLPVPSPRQFLQPQCPALPHLCTYTHTGCPGQSIWAHTACCPLWLWACAFKVVFFHLFLILVNCIFSSFF